MANLFARHPHTVKDMIVAETLCPLHQEPVKVGFEMNGVQGKLTVREHCSILQMGEKCSEACRSNPEILEAVHKKMAEFKEESAREIPIISTP
ncbi:MAG: hypothetical protein KF854_03400 [Nitrospira sp.]|nr:hypothetical protein [Nitrospira sp.]MBX3343259.1 hypothetical protein [Nitrospira sp.]MBX3371879.1 hypothetical protein [Nitrospira sp.]MBX7040970.1 hypothetical protein [Nitrospira sp.]MCW5796688.1 hypothetical protein [Nitrospira sp.]